VDVVSNDLGQVFQQSFDVFGSPLTGPSPELTRAGYTGHQHDRDLGLIDMGGRIYDPLSAQFVSRDPVTQAPFWSQGLNGYAYVFNDPVNNVDPTGFAADGSAAGGGGLIGGLLLGGLAARGVVPMPSLGINMAIHGYQPGTFQMDARPGNGSARPPVQEGIPALDGGIPDGLRGLDEREANRLLQGANNLLNRYGPKAAETAKRLYDAAKPAAVRAGQRLVNALSRLCRSSPVPRIHMGQQGKHIVGHNNYIPGRSIFKHSDPQGLLNRFGGTGQPVGNVERGLPGFRERVDFQQVIGEINGVETTKGIIHYAKDGAHIVPALP
jgi:RHS repeat-associated protein